MVDESITKNEHSEEVLILLWSIVNASFEE
jgi:hypothetical protein